VYQWSDFAYAYFVPECSQEELARTGYKYYCHNCQLGFLKERNYQQVKHAFLHKLGLTCITNRRFAWIDSTSQEKLTQSQFRIKKQHGLHLKQLRPHGLHAVQALTQ